MSTFEQRYKIHTWMVEHPQEIVKHANKWIAVTCQGIIASGDSLVEIAKRNHVKQEDAKGNVVFSLIPDPSKALVV